MYTSSPDFTMKDPCCTVDNDARAIIESGQVIEFDAPVFVDTLDITTFGTTINMPFIKGIDWDITKSDIDTKTMSSLRMENEAFTKVVVSSFTVLRELPENTILKIAMTYQLVYPTQAKKVALRGEPINVNPVFLREMAKSIEYLLTITKTVDDVHSSLGFKPPRVLIEDPHKQNSANFIDNERHAVSTATNQIVVHPAAGAFFKDSVVIVYKDPSGIDKELVEGVDYLIEGPDFQRTGYSQNPSGVYHFIFLITSLVGDLDVSYHAYGGSATNYDIRLLYEGLNNVKTYLDNMSYLTSDGLKNDPTIQNLIHSQLHLGENMRRLLNQGKPSYGDSTNGSTLLKKLTATDDKLHWWTIATLYKVDTDMGQSEVITADVFKFRLKSQNFKIMFEAIVSLNLANKYNKFSVSVTGDNPAQGYKPFEDYADIELYPRPQLRVIYNKTNEMNSGVMLQIGMTLPGTLSEIIAVEDMSGKESCWKLPPHDGSMQDLTPDDDIVTLPNEANIWDTTNPDSVQHSTLVPFKHGHLVWAGSVPVNTGVSGKISTPLDHFLDDNVDIKSVSRVRIEFEEASGTRLAYEAPMIIGTESKMGNVPFYYNGAQAYTNIITSRDPVTHKLLIDLEANISAGSSANRLDLKHVIFLI